jgi:ABC-type phosphate transport system substrate-binding protein
MKRFILPLALAILTLSGCLAPDLPPVPEVNSDFKPPETTSKPQAFITETNPLFTGGANYSRLPEAEFFVDDLEVIPEADDEIDADLYADSDSRWYELSGRYDFPILYSDYSLLSLGAYAASTLTENDFRYAKYRLRLGGADYAVNNLVFGEADAAIAGKLTSEQMDIVNSAEGFELGAEIIGYTGLVFFTDPTNEIESVSVDFLRRIYTGEIENWAKIGGEDRAIMPFQHNDESSAQFYMEYSFMDRTEMIPPQTASVFIDDETVRVTAEYKNLPGAIGYAIYSQVIREQESAGNIKILSVNGVKPTPETLRDGSYPVASETYLYYNAENAGAKTLADWFASKEGQTAVVRAGYYPVSDIPLLPENKAYKAIGTGIPKSEGAAFSGKYSYFTNLSNGGIDFLGDSALTNEVNAWISKKANGSDDTLIMSTIINGYLSVTVVSDEYENDRVFPTAVWDIIGKRKIENFSDLFYKDSDYSLTLGIAAATALEEDYAEYNGLEKTDFVGFAGEIAEDTFGTEQFTLYGETAYFTDWVRITFSLQYDLNSVVSGYRNFDDALTEGNTVYDKEFASVL